MKLAYELDNGIGKRANMGVIVLETDETLEAEFRRLLDLDDVALYHSRIPMVAEINAASLGRMETDLPASAALFPKDMSFDVIGYGCTSAATVIGSDRVAAAIQTQCVGAKVTDPLAALIAAGEFLGVRKIGFVTPYIASVSQAMRDKLEAAGFTIAAFGSFEEGNDYKVARISPASIAQAVREVAAEGDLDAIIVACTNLRCLGVIPALEQELDIAILSSNQALAWHMRQLAGIDVPEAELGRLFEGQLEWFPAD